MNKKILHLIRISEASFKETTEEIRPLLFVSIIPEKNALFYYLGVAALRLRDHRETAVNWITYEKLFIENLPAGLTR